MNPNLLSGDYQLYNTSMSIEISMNSSSVLTDCIITGSVLSSHYKSFTLYTTESAWLNGNTALESALENNGSYAGKGWTDINNILVDDSNYAYCNNTLSSSLNSPNQFSRILQIEDFISNNNIDFTDVYSIRGIELMIKKSIVTSSLVIQHQDKFVKLGLHTITDISPGNNNYDSGSNWIAPLSTNYYGSMNDTWGISINKNNIKHVYAGIGITAKNSSPPAFDFTGIQYIGAKVYFNKKNIKAAAVQDFEPTDYANLKYNGCKISSTDFNQPSLDTPDGGPVVEFNIVNPNEIIVETNVNNFYNINTN